MYIKEDFFVGEAPEIVDNQQFTVADYDLLCNKLGNFFEMDKGNILWRFNGEVLPANLVRTLLAEPDPLHLLASYEMATENHNILVSNIHFSLRLALQHQPYRVYTQAPNIYIALTQKYRIPDAAVVPKKVVLNEQKWVTNPLILVEVVSPSSEKIDIADKLREYTSLESLQEYLIVSQDSYDVSHYVRHSVNKWIFRTYNSLDEKISLPSVKVSLEMKDIYEKLDIIVA